MDRRGPRRRPLTVRQALEKTRAPGLQLELPRTKRSRRTIALPAVAVEGLRTHWKEQANVELGAGKLYVDQGLVFTATPTVRSILTR